MIQVGIISDTHSLLRPEALRTLAGSDLIVHAGDIGSAEVIRELAELAPIHAIRGNIDTADWAKAYAEDEVVEVNGKYLYVLHNLNDLDLDPAAAGFDVVISGHSHQPKIFSRDSVLYINPGSAGPRRFKLPIALATLSISNNKLNAEIVELA